MIAYIGLCVVDYWSDIDGERYVGDQGQAFEDQQQAQEIILVTYTPLIQYLSYACVHFDDLSKIIDDCYPEFLVTYFGYAFG